MKVILREDLQGVGNIGDILEVAPGYARNFLFPRNKAVEATGRSLKAIEHAKRVIAEKARKEKTVLEEVAKKVSAIAVTIPVQVGKEGRRQREKVLLIASENFASPAVLAAQGSLMTNKYAEGYPGRRYYGGCQYMDVVESLAIERAKQIFGADHVNVQPHSGAQANMAVYFAVLKPGDAILGMDLAHGGHLTHGSRVSFSGILYRAYSYGVDRTTERIDYDAVRKMAEECRPRLIVVGASAYPRTLDFPKFHEIAKAVGAYLMVDIAHIAGLIAAGLHPSPIPYADFVTTTTHKTLRGPRGGMVMCKAEYAKALDKAVFPGLQGGPLMHVIAAKAVALKEALSPGFKKYQQHVLANAKALASGLQKRGFRIVRSRMRTLCGKFPIFEEYR